MTFLEDNEGLQEFALILQDKLRGFRKVWLYALAVTVVLSIPLYYLLRVEFFNLAFDNYQGPAVTYTKPELESLQVIDSKIFELSENSYSGYVKIRNINLDWGVSAQNYQAVFKTLGGSTVTKVSGQTFILPSSVKILVFPKLTLETKPAKIDFLLDSSHFVHKPDLPNIDLKTSRVSLQRAGNALAVSAVLTNSSPFILTRVDLPAVLYDLNNQIVGVNFTNVNDVKTSEGRSFQLLWPANAASTAVRAEINPEINIFDRKVLSLPSPTSPFDNLQNGNADFQ